MCGTVALPLLSTFVIRFHHKEHAGKSNLGGGTNKVLRWAWSISLNISVFEESSCVDFGAHKSSRTSQTRCAFAKFLCDCGMVKLCLVLPVRWWEDDSTFPTNHGKDEWSTSLLFSGRCLFSWVNQPIFFSIAMLVTRGYQSTLSWDQHPKYVNRSVWNREPTFYYRSMYLHMYIHKFIYRIMFIFVPIYIYNYKYMFIYISMYNIYIYYAIFDHISLLTLA